MTPVVLRIKLRYDDVEVMVLRFAPNVGKSGLFLPTKSIQPVGTEIKFELRLANDQPVLVGLGRVKHAREPDADQPRAVYGLGIELMRVTREGRDLILRMLDRRRRLGLADPGVPTPEDVEAARRAVEEEESAVNAVPAIREIESPSEALLTAPRPTAVAASAKLHVVEPLAAEPPRKRRPTVSEVIESASGPLGAITVPGLDDDVDVGAAIARARLLATGDVDSELEALREEGAAPLIEIAIDAASAELARQLGGIAVRRDRSQRGWAPPPAVVAEPPPDPEPEPEPPVTALSDEPLLPSFADDDDLDDPDHDSLDLGIIERDAADDSHLAHALSGPLIDDQVDPADFDEIHQLSEADFDEIEHTQIGANPEEYVELSYSADPGAAALEERLEAHLAEAEAEADDLGLGLPPVDDSPHDSYEGLSGALPEASLDDAEEIEEFEILAEADADDADLLASHGEADITGGVRAPTPMPAPASSQPRRPSLSDFASRLDLDDESDLYPNPPEPGYYERSRNLSDQLPSHSELDPRVRSAGHALAQFEDDNLTPDPGAIPEAYPQPDSDDSFTHPEDFDSPHSSFQPPHAFDQSDVIAIPPELGGPQLRPQPPPPEDYDLETALEALDVDLDDISMPHASTELQREGAHAQRIAGRPTIRPPAERGLVDDDPGSARVVGPTPITPAGRTTRRASTEDGIVIDFDDDD